MLWKQIESITDLEEALKLSFEHPVIIFKHSRLCSLSSTVLRAFEARWNDAEMTNVKPYFLDLISYREISNQIAQRMKIAHQSPQLLLVKEGICVYDSSHFNIKYEEILNTV